MLLFILIKIKPKIAEKSLKIYFMTQPSIEFTCVFRSFKMAEYFLVFLPHNKSRVIFRYLCKNHPRRASASEVRATPFDVVRVGHRL